MAQAPVAWQLELSQQAVELVRLVLAQVLPEPVAPAQRAPNRVSELLAPK
jgi:hypothetical protein